MVHTGLGRDLGGRRTWLVVAATLMPLAALLGLQYRWLQRLERVSAVAHRATLDNYLEAVAAAVELHYRSIGERALNLPSALFTADRVGKAAYHFAKKGCDEGSRFFVVGFVGPAAGQTLFYDARTGALVEPEWSDEVRAVYAAAASWKVLAAKQARLERPALEVDDRDPARRMILNPITDEAGHVVGLAGMIADPAHFERVVLPRLVAESLPKFARGGGEQPVVVARGTAGRVLELGGAAPARAPEASLALAPPFRDYTLDIYGRHRTPADWARRNFALNLALSLLLSGVVAGGVLFALRAASREMRLSQMKSDFVSNVSHELRTPLASIRVFGELLRLGRADSAAKVREYGELIETESRRLTGLIDNILDLARIESGRKSYQLAPADLEAVVAETLRTFRVGLAPVGFRFLYRGAAAALPPLRLDAAAIAQALGNLLDNAVKYSGDQREIEVGIRRDEAGWAVVWVRDAGIGIPRAELDKIFERFHRVSTGLVHDVKGSGLGLAIVRHVAEAHGGRVEVESRPGAGSTFSLWLPLAAPAAERGTIPAGPRPSEA